MSIEPFVFLHSTRNGIHGGDSLPRAAGLEKHAIVETIRSPCGHTPPQPGK
jgi:hypothetical protein